MSIDDKGEKTMGKFKKNLSSFLSVAVISVSAASFGTVSAEELQPAAEIVQPEIVPIRAELDEERSEQKEEKEEREVKFQAITGVIQKISDHGTKGDMKFITIEVSEDNIVNIVLSNRTYLVDETALEEGMEIVAFYDAMKPVILIYPPQYNAEAIAVVEEGRTVKLDRFDEELISSDGMLKLKVSEEETEVISEDGLPFTGELTDRKLVVTYGVSTRSIPAQTTPSQIVVLNEDEPVSADEEAVPDALPFIDEDQNDQKEDVVNEEEAPISEENTETMNTTTLEEILESAGTYEDEQGYEMAPLRQVAERLGYPVTWLSAEQTVQIGQDLSLKIGDSIATKSSERIELEAASVVKDGVTYVPVSFFEKALSN